MEMAPVTIGALSVGPAYRFTDALVSIKPWNEEGVVRGAEVLLLARLPSSGDHTRNDAQPNTLHAADGETFPVDWKMHCSPVSICRCQHSRSNEVSITQWNSLSLARCFSIRCWRGTFFRFIRRTRSAARPHGDLVRGYACRVHHHIRQCHATRGRLRSRRGLRRPTA